MELVLIIIGAVALLAVLFFVGGYVASRRRAEHWSEHVAQAEEALEVAWAADKGFFR